jgi:phage recombination protein Bet
MAEHQSGTLVAQMAEHYNLSPEEFRRVIKATCGLQKASDEEFLAFLMIAHEHKLNPLTREIYAFVKPGGGIQPIVGVDGWYKKVNEHPMFNGMTFRDEQQGGQLVAVTAIIHRKDRLHPTEVTEYMRECRRDTDPWRRWPARMLRHKAAVQAIRAAFNLAGVMDRDEAERYMDMLQDTPRTSIEVTPDDLPRPSAGRIRPTPGAAAEDTAHSASPSPDEVQEEDPTALPSPPVSEPAPQWRDTLREIEEELVSPEEVARLKGQVAESRVDDLELAKLLETYGAPALEGLRAVHYRSLIGDLIRIAVARTGRKRSAK